MPPRTAIRRSPGSMRCRWKTSPSRPARSLPGRSRGRSSQGRAPRSHRWRRRRDPRKSAAAIRASASPSISEIGSADLRIVGERLGASRGDDIPGFEEVGVVRQLQGEAGVLLHEQHAYMLLAADAVDDVENLLDDTRGEAKGGLV